MEAHPWNDNDPWEFRPECTYRCTNARCSYRIGSARDFVSSAFRKLSWKDLNDNRNPFIPRGDIVSHLGHERLSQLLVDLLGEDGSLLASRGVSMEDLVTYIAPQDQDCRCGSDSCTGARLLFATLILMAKEDEILEFYKLAADECDKTLKIGNIEKRLPDASDSLPVIKSWTHDEKTIFSQVQWQMRSPVLQKLDTLSFSPIDLDDEVTLPWVESQGLRRIVTDETGSRSIKSHLGIQYSFIRRIKIHPQHHNLDAQEFALKVFKDKPNSKSSNRKYTDELEANKRLRGPHERIIPLLSAFRHKDASYLLFPWASRGTLKDLWKTTTSSKEPEPAFPEWFSIEWLWEQCLGLADAFAYTHGLIPSTSGQKAERQLHADLTPDNILVFPSEANVSIPFLKLADFGLSRKVDSNGRLPKAHITATLTYEPPEQVLLKEQASLQWDIWRLGCLYLEFITWGLLGYHGVKEFAVAREREIGDHKASKAQGDSFVDTFFKKTVAKPWLYWIPGYRMKVAVRVKESVHYQIARLKGASQCDTRLREFLDFINHHMLVVNDELRASSLEVRDFLKSH